MPWKLIGLLLLLTILLIFAGLNIQGVTVTLGFVTFANIPLFFCLFFSFLAGALFGVSLTIIDMKRKVRGREKSREEKLQRVKEKKEKTPDSKLYIDDSGDEDGIHKPETDEETKA
jgi:uncharacterized integral membrane protein